MFLRLTDSDNNLVLVNTDKIDAVFLGTVKGKRLTKVGLTNNCYLHVKETVSEISLLLQAAGRVIK